MKLKLVFFLAAALFLQACGYKLPESSSNANNPSNSSAQKDGNVKNENIGINSTNANSGAANSKESESDKTPLVLSGTNETLTFPCNGREVEVDESTTANNYAFTGECKKLTVDGVSNMVKVEKVGEIVVKGTSNKVVYGEGLGGKKPKITKSGVSTAVDSKKSFDERKARESRTN